jgi:hypothetical protein
MFGSRDGFGTFKCSGHSSYDSRHQANDHSIAGKPDRKSLGRFGQRERLGDDRFDRIGLK